MVRSRSPNRIRAFELFRESHGKLTSKEIAELLGESDKNIQYWRTADDWNGNYNPKGGAPKGNQNALGHKGVTPLENQNARKEGWYSKYYPTKVRNLIKEAEKAGSSPLEILWAQIMTQWIAIVRAQEIMYVDSRDDKTIELKKLKTQTDMVGPKGNQTPLEVYREEEYEIQQAWDKHANFLNAQSRAMTTLSNLIRRYDEMLHNSLDLATEEQKLRIEKLKEQIKNPEFEHKKKVSEEKLKIERERLEHQKKMDESKVW